MNFHHFPGRRPTPLQLFFFLSLAGILAFFLFMPFLGIHGLDWLVMENNSDFESADYFLVLLFSLGGENAYHFGVDACYPPLAYGVFRLIAEAVSLPQLLHGVDLFSVPYEELIAMTFDLLVSPYQLLVFLLYVLLGVFLFLCAAGTLNLSNRLRSFLMASIIFSVPMAAGAVERGNLTLYAAGLALLALVLRDSKSPIGRELALICIAVAAGFKIYPAFMGLLYLRERRFKEAGRLILYGAAAVFVPFFWFGGLDGLRTLLESLQALSGQISNAYRIQYFKGLLTFIGLYGKKSDLFNLLFLALLIFLIFKTRDKIRLMTYLAASMALFPPNAYRYTILFFLLPLFLWIKEEKDRPTLQNYIRALFFGLIFTIPSFFGLLTGFRLNFGKYTLTFVEVRLYLAVWLFLFLQIAADLWALWRSFRTGSAPIAATED